MRERDPSAASARHEQGAPAPLRRRLDFGPGGPRLWAATLIADGRTRLGLVFEREMEAGRGFLWLPVLFGVGVITYFALPREPSLIALLGVSLVLILAARRARDRIGAYRVLVAAAAIVCGVTATKLRTDAVAAPVVARETTLEVTGWIAAREEAAHGATRFLVHVKTMGRLTGDDRPTMIRVTARRAGDIAVGDGVRLLARLQPPGGPVMPGGYDFSRTAFYRGIGGVGFSYGAPKPAVIGPPPLGIRLSEPLDHLRDTIRRRIEEALPGDDGHLAAALIVGETGGISDETQNAMRASGLGHVLAISGLHMALVAGSAFWLLRALLALSPRMALTRPIKKWAAAGGLFVAAVYLAISGASISTERAFAMLAIMLLAILLDRRAITLRNVALGALIVLALTPESLLTPGFQMSFAATVALVAGYQALAERADRGKGLAERGGGKPLQRMVAGIGALVFTSLVAGLATAPFAAFHFQRLAPLTLLANLAAMPVFGLLVMPAALGAVLLMPFGLEVVPLAAMKWGLDWIVGVAGQVAEWTGDAGAVRMMPAAALLLLVAGFLWLTLWHERWRLAGLAPILVAIPLALLAPRPDVIVNEKGTAVAVRGQDGRYRILGGKGATFAVENWLRADADTRDPKAASLKQDIACDPLGCVAKLAGAGGEVAFVTEPDAFAEDCRLSAIVVSRLSAPPGCGAETLLIDRAALDRFGAQALYRQAGSKETDKSSDATGQIPAKPTFRVDTAYPMFKRPFMQPSKAFNSAE